MRLVRINRARYTILSLVLLPLISYGLDSYHAYAESPSFDRQIIIDSPDAESPSFVRQIIIDSPDDWFVVKTSQKSVFVNGADGNKYLIPTGENATQCGAEKNRFPDITSVSYFSDGKSLNATLWLHTPFYGAPFKFRRCPVVISSDQGCSLV